MTEWWTQQQAGLFGAGVGVVGGLLGAMCGTLAPLAARGRLPGWARAAGLAVWYGAIAAGAVLLLTALYAGWAGQPWHVRYPLTLAGSIIFPLAAGLVTLPWTLGALQRAHRRDASRSPEGSGAAAFCEWANASPQAWSVVIDLWRPGGRCRRWLVLVLAGYLVVAAALAYQDFTLASPLAGRPGAVRFLASAAFQALIVAATLVVLLVALGVQVRRLRARLEERHLAAAELRRG